MSINFNIFITNLSRYCNQDYKVLGDLQMNRENAMIDEYLVIDAASL